MATELVIEKAYEMASEAFWAWVGEAPDAAEAERRRGEWNSFADRYYRQLGLDGYEIV